MLAEQKAGGYSTKYRFTGKEVDEETGLYYFGARYYDPRISLWYGVDPLTEKYFDYSPFTYTANNPIKYIDPDGRGWYEDECGSPQFDKNIKNKEDFAKSGINGRFLGNSGVNIDAKGNQTSYNADGSKTPGVPLDEITFNADKGTGLSNNVEQADNIGDKIDPAIGFTLNYFKKSINNKLKNQFSTISESVEDVLSRSGSIKTPIGSVKATSALKFAKGLGTFGAGLNIISAVNYFNEIRSGNSAKGYAGLGMMAATSLTMGLCPPCALAALAGSATYSLYLEDKIFKPKK